MASDIKLKAINFKFGEYELVPQERLKSGKHELARDNFEQFSPDPILLVFESESPYGSEYHVNYVSSLLTFVTRRRVRFCTFGGRAHAEVYPDSGNTNFIPSSCREIFGTDIRINNTKPFYEYAPEDEKAVLVILAKIHDKIMTYPENEKNTILNLLNIFQLSIMLEHESLDLVSALLISSLETIANNDNLFKFRNDNLWVFLMAFSLVELLLKYFIILYFHYIV